MIEKLIDDISFLFFEHLLPFRDLLHANSTRCGGTSTGQFSSLNLGVDTGDTKETVLKNYSIVSRALKFDLSSLVASRQVHGNNVAFIDDKFEKTNQFRMEPVLFGFDALITARAEITLMVRVADCVPLTFFDPVKRVVAVAHAGWRSTLAAIAEETIKEMTLRYKSEPQHILVGIGPSIGPCCYRVQKKVAALFETTLSGPDVWLEERTGELFLNLWEANRQQLLHRGILPEHIEVAGLCTACRSDLFFSHRREQGKTGRLGAFVGLRG